MAKDGFFLPGGQSYLCSFQLNLSIASPWAPSLDENFWAEFAFAMSVSESNAIAASTEPEQGHYTHSFNLNFQGLKCEEHEVIKSPNASIWESLFGDPMEDSCDDSSPKRDPCTQGSSPSRCSSPSQTEVEKMTGIGSSSGSSIRSSSDPHKGATHEQLKPQIGLDHSLPGSFSVEQDQVTGVQLVHLLLACAEAVDRHDFMWARRYLQHINREVTPVGNSMQRVASCFADALSGRLLAAVSSGPNTSNPRPFPPFPLNSLEIIKLYQIMYQAFPYIKFAHFTCNQAIFEAFEHEEQIHIIDLDILQGYQWPCLMQALSARPGGSPFIRITGVGSPLEAVLETGRCLTELSHSLQIRLEFHPVGVQLQDLKPHMLDRREGEALAVNSVNHLHLVPSNHLGNVLGMIRDLSPNIVTLVEKEASHSGSHFLGRFTEALHYYSAIFDSIDMTLSADSVERAKIEQYMFSPEIQNIVACEGDERVLRHERLEKWRKVMQEMGFTSVPLSSDAVTQSHVLLSMYRIKEYSLTEDNGCLLLGWQDRPLVAASSWSC